MVRGALPYALAQSPQACVIPGFKNPRQLDFNAQTPGRPLTADEVALVKQTWQG